MSFKNHSYKKLANQKDILACVSDAELFEYYLGGIPYRAVSSPLREDKVPSFSVFFSERHGKLMFKDFATDETGDVFIFLMRLFRYTSITDVFNKIVEDFSLTQFSSKPIVPIGRKIKKIKGTGSLNKRRSRINVKLRKWKIKDKDYWNVKYGLTMEQLEYCGIFPISHYFVNGLPIQADELAYAFVEDKDGKKTFKIYQPFNVENKWVSNNDHSTWELWQQLPDTGENLIITSSRKDAAVIKSLFTSKYITSCALQGEKVNPKNHVMGQLIDRFENIYVFYDNDQGKDKNWGRLAGKKLADLYSFYQIEIPDKYNIKDISDFREKKGKVETKLLIKNLLTQI